MTTPGARPRNRTARASVSQGAVGMGARSGPLSRSPHPPPRGGEGLHCTAANTRRDGPRIHGAAGGTAPGKCKNIKRFSIVLSAGTMYYKAHLVCRVLNYHWLVT